MIVKVCGMRDAENIREVESLDIDLMGFIFYPKSPRYVDVTEYLPRCRKVGVFVNADLHTITDTANTYDLWGVQLHGHESAEDCSRIKRQGLKVIKAFSVGDKLPDNPDAYENCCDMFIFDTACKEYGGSGRQFNWDVMKAYHGTTPFLLSGGIGPESLAELARFSHPQWVGIDINSSIELAPGIKDVIKLRAFIDKFRNMNPTNTCNKI